MRRLLVTLALAAAAPAAAQIQWSEPPDAETCGEWEKLGMSGRIEKLRTIQPFGDELEAADRAAAEDWANEVAGACRGAPDKTLEQAARQAMRP